MENKYYSHKCGNDDVLAFGDTTFKVGKFQEALNKSFGNSVGSKLTSELSCQGVKLDDETFSSSKWGYDPYSRWFDQGVDCEILNLGAKKWKKGKVKIKISIEFYVAEEADSKNEPEISEPESPLDDLRQMLNSK